MNWLVYGCGLLISSAALVALSIYNTELAEYKGYSPCIDCWEDGLLTIILS